MVIRRWAYLILIFAHTIGCNNQNDSQKLINHPSLEFLIQSKNQKLTLKKRLHLINTAYEKTKSKPTDSLTLAVIYDKSNIHFRLEEIDSTFHYDKLLFKKANEINDDYYLGKTSMALAFYYKNKELYDSAYYYYNVSKNHFSNLKDSSQIGRRLLSMSLIQQNQNDFFGSKETSTEALEYLDLEKDKKYVASSFNALATNHRKLMNYEEAIKYSKKAIYEAPSPNDKLAYKNNLATVYIDSEKYNQALRILEQVQSDSIMKKHTSQYARVLDNFAYAKWLSGGAFDEEQFQEPLRIRINNKDKRGQIASYTHLGEYHSKSNKLKATAYFDSVIRISKNLKIPRAEKDAINHLMRLYPKNVELRDRYVFLQDSLYAQELKVKTQFAKYKYDDKLKQESILRLEKTNAEKELEVAQQRNQKIVLFTVGGILLLLFGFAINFFVQRTKRLKQENKTAKLEATFEAEEELSRRLHDDFGGKLNHTMLLLQNGTNTSEILDSVEGLYNQSRDFSRKINDVDTGPNYKDLLFGMLGTYSENTKLAVTGSMAIDWNNISALTKKTLYRVLHELMSNMEKYSEATLVAINFEQTNKMLKVDYSDNGIGATKENLNNRNGLWNTEKRIHAIDGTITFDSEKGKGFKAQIEIPN